MPSFDNVCPQYSQFIIEDSLHNKKSVAIILMIFLRQDDLKIAAVLLRDALIGRVPGRGVGPDGEAVREARPQGAL